MRKYRKNPKIGERWNTAAMGWDGRSMRYMCYTAERGRSALKGVKVKLKVHALDIAPLHSESSPQKR